MCATDAPWLLKPGTYLGPSSRMVDVDSNFTMHCTMPDRWRAADTHWHVYFILTAVYCQLYPKVNNSTCSRPYDLGRFSVDRDRYTLLLHVTSATVNDTGLYACVRPAYFSRQRPTAHVAYVGMIREFPSSFNVFHDDSGVVISPHLDHSKVRSMC